MSEHSVKAANQSDPEKKVRVDAQGNVIRSYLVGRKSKASAASVALDEELKDAESEEDENVGYYQQAEILMEQLSDGSYSVGRIPAYQKKMIFFYLSVFHPKISRIVDLHTKLPMSSLRIQKPDHPVDIVQDYVYDFFEGLLESTSFRRELKKSIKNYWVFGEGPTLLEDDYEFVRDTILDPSLEGLSLKEIPEEEKEELDRINNQYNTDPDSVTWAEKLKVLNRYILNVNPDYRGLIRMTSIFPLKIRGVAFNSDIDYWVYSLPKSDSLNKLLSTGKFTKPDSRGASLVDVSKLKKYGYSQALVMKNVDASDSQIEVDNDPFNDEGLYIARLASENNAGVDNSLLNSVLEPAIQNILAIRKSNALVSLASKIDRLVSAPKASMDQLDQLNEDLAEMGENPEGSMLAVNFDVTIDELSLDVSDNLDLNDTIDRTDKEILSALGMPEELISGEGTYGSGFLKVELLTNEYVEFRNSLKDFIENQIFKPIAIKKGFVSHNAWGDLVPIYPKVRFDKFSISRSSEDFSQMMSLVSDDKLPVEILLEHMGFTAEDIEQKLLRQTGTMFNSSIKDLIDSAISQMDERLLENPEFIDRIMQALSLNDKESDAK